MNPPPRFHAAAGSHSMRCTCTLLVLACSTLGLAQPARPEGRPAAPPRYAGVTFRERNANGYLEYASERDPSVILVLVPGGVRTMGSEGQDADTDEGPATRVELPPFFLGRCEITRAQYARFCRATGRPLPAAPPGAGPEHPVSGITWTDASAYCRWAKGALPTEAQWEAAARGEGDGPWPWGSEPPGISRRANLGRQRGGTFEGDARDGYEGIAPVGSYPAGKGPYGMLDLAGNVWEWCADWYGNRLPGGRVQAPTGPPAGLQRVVRGGAYDCPASFLRVTHRASFAPDVALDVVGFRLALPASPLPASAPESGGPAPGPGGPQAFLGVTFDALNAQGFAEYELEKDPTVRLVAVPAAEFQLGSLAVEADDDEGPTTRVRLGAFLIARGETSNAQWARFCRAAGRPVPAFDADEADLPVVGIDWEEARAYCAWAGGALPTEAQWEYAAKGGEGRRYPWGATSPGAEHDRANVGRPGSRADETDERDGYAERAPVTAFPAGASPFGTLNQAGNVWEWCSSRYAERYPGGRIEGYDGPVKGADLRVIRGGGFRTPPARCRTTFRFAARPTSRNPELGFRLVLPARPRR
jgi:formylglycine-generating enzyme required for sulfatase activity